MADLLFALYYMSLGLAVSSGKCLPPAPASLCSAANCNLPDTNNCQQYFTCVAETNCGIPYLAYKTMRCEKDMFYDQMLGKCVDTLTCPSNPDITKPCNVPGERFGLPNSCRKYAECMIEDSISVWEEKQCKPNQFFEVQARACVRGICPLCFEAAPWYGKCDIHGPGHRFGHVHDCTKFFTCKLNAEDCKQNMWGREENSCPAETYFDVVTLECIRSPECPQVCPPRAGSLGRCSQAEQNIQNCKSVWSPHYYKAELCSGRGCRMVKTCAKNCYEEYMTLDTTYSVSCEGQNEFYDSKRAACVKALTCPPHDEEESCPLFWDYMADRGFDGGVFTDKSFCRAFNEKEGKYKYGYFDGNRRTCQIYPADLKVNTELYEVLSVQNTHLTLSTDPGFSRTGATFGKKTFWFAAFMPQCESCEAKPGMTFSNISSQNAMWTYEDLFLNQPSFQKFHDWYMVIC